MAITRKDVEDSKKQIRAQSIRKIANKVAERNDEGLRRLSKS